MILSLGTINKLIQLCNFHSNNINTVDSQGYDPVQHTFNRNEKTILFQYPTPLSNTSFLTFWEMMCRFMQFRGWRAKFPFDSLVHSDGLSSLSLSLYKLFQM